MSADPETAELRFKELKKKIKAAGRKPTDAEKIQIEQLKAELKQE
jgi:hypothetical protein